MDGVVQNEGPEAVHLRLHGSELLGKQAGFGCNEASHDSC